MQEYIGLIHKDPDSDFSVSFPDFPGVITVGRSLDEAREMAAEALAFHIEGMIEDGDLIPAPSRLKKIMADPENRDGLVILVAVDAKSPKVVQVSLPEDLVTEIDRFAKAHGLTRSGFLAQAARRALQTA